MPRVISARCTDNTFILDFTDGRCLHVPLRDFPRLLAASPEQRSRVRISRRCLHWDELDERLSVAALIRVYGGNDQSLLESRLKSVDRAVKVNLDDL